MANALLHAEQKLLTSSRKAVAIGLNYIDHCKEMKSQPDRSDPFWFFKPATSYLFHNSGPILLPKTAVVHHEVELAVIIGKPATDVPASRATEHIAGYLCAIDLTARNWQNAAKAAGRPWAMAKGCDTFLPMSSIIPPDSIVLDADGNADVTLWLDVNGKRRQHASTTDMIHNIPKLIEHISAHCTLEEWDIILTGTPSGVSQIHPGDKITAGIEGLVDMSFAVTQRP